MDTVKRKDCEEALGLLKELNDKLDYESIKDLKPALEKVITVLESNLFGALLDIQEYYEEILRDVHRSPAQVQREAAILAKKWENVSLEEKIRSVEEIMSRISETGSPTNGVSTCDSNLEITSNGVNHIKVKTDHTKMPSQYDTGVPRILVDSQKTITTPTEVPLKETCTDKPEMTDITSGVDISIADEKLDLPPTENIQSVSDDGSLTDSYEELVLQANDQEKH